MEKMLELLRSAYYDLSYHLNTPFPTTHRINDTVRLMESIQEVLDGQEESSNASGEHNDDG